MLCMRVLIRPRAPFARARAHISVSVFVALSRERFFDFPETSLLRTKFYILSSYKRSSILELKRARSRSLTHTHTEREKERENISRI